MRFTKKQLSLLKDVCAYVENAKLRFLDDFSLEWIEIPFTPEERRVMSDIYKSVCDAYFKGEWK